MFKFSCKFRRRRGFTLVEMLTVVLIVATLAALAVPRFTDVSASAYGSKVVADMRTIDSAISMYIAQYDKAPTSLDNLLSPESGDPNDQRAGLMSQIPVPPTANNDPVGGQYGTSIVVESNGYRVRPGQTSYRLIADRSRVAVQLQTVFLANTTGGVGMVGWYTVEGIASGKSFEGKVNPW